VKKRAIMSSLRKFYARLTEFSDNVRLAESSLKWLHCSFQCANRSGAHLCQVNGNKNRIPLAL
jgi:hypothetical protein